MTERLDRIEALLLGLAERQTAHESRLERQEERTERIEANFERLQQQLNQIAEGQTANVDQIGRNAEANTANTEAVAQNEQRFSTLLEDSRADRAENRRRFDAAQQVIQALLMQVANLNGRVEDLEGAA